MNNLIIAIFCRDERSNLWRQLLKSDDRCTEIYIVSSENEIEDREGNSIPSSHLPQSFTVSFIHSGDRDLWQNKNAQYIFQFNAPGNPYVNQHELPIYRETSPEFKISSEDITNIVDFITGKTTQIPTVCTQPNYGTTIPALSILCQGYLAIHPNTNLNREVMAYLPKDVSLRIKKTEETEWWQKPFIKEKKDTLLEKITAEWQPQQLPTEVSNLIEAIYSTTPMTDVEMVEGAYKAIAARLTSI